MINQFSEKACKWQDFCRISNTVIHFHIKTKKYNYNGMVSSFKRFPDYSK